MTVDEDGPLEGGMSLQDPDESSPTQIHPDLERSYPICGDLRRGRI